MRVQLLCATAVLAFTSAPVLACSCVQPPSSAKTDSDKEQWYANKSDAIFEGTVERAELHWTLMDAKVGALVSADLEQEEPALQVMFIASRFYKGVEQKDVVLTTGLGSGDCGFDFEIGKEYLVYASEDAAGHLSTGICSGTGLLQNSRSEFSAAGKLCGRINGEGIELVDSKVFLFRVGNKSPMASEEAEVASDGSFCIEGARPGNYYLAFMSRAEDPTTSFVFFPGTTNPTEARAIELKSGQLHAALTLTLPPQPTFSVSGNVRAGNKSPLPAECKVSLLNTDPALFFVSYSTDVDRNGSFDFPRVLPGKYWTFVGVNSDVAANWLTRKDEVEVNVTVSNLSLELFPK